MKRIFVTLLSLFLTFTSACPVFAAEISFGDVPSTAYYTAAVNWAVGKGIASGTSSTTFSPNSSCTHGQIITFLYRAVGSPAVNTGNPYSNKDITPDCYYYSPLLWAHENGIILDTNLNPNTPCTRGDTILYIWRYCGAPIVTPTPQFKDLPVATGIFNLPVLTVAASWAVKEGITSGTSPTTFSPDSICTRAQVVTFLWRAMTNQQSNGSSTNTSKLETTPTSEPADVYEVPIGQVGSTLFLGKKAGFYFSTSYNMNELPHNGTSSFIEVSSSDESAIIVSSNKISMLDSSSNEGLLGEYPYEWSEEGAKIEGHVVLFGNLLGTSTITVRVGDRILMSKDITVESDRPAILANGEPISDGNIRNIIYGLRAKYPDGTPWGKDATYYSAPRNMTYSACDAFARMCSDTAFGTLPLSDKHSDFDRIRVGDWVSYISGPAVRHAVFVLEKKENSIVVVEGNVTNADGQGFVRWGREIPRQLLEKNDLRVESRYTVKN